MLKAEKVPGAKHMDAKMYILFPRQEKAVTVSCSQASWSI